MKMDAENIPQLKSIAETAGHPRRLEAMLLLNSFARPHPIFESALDDPDPAIRSAAYSSLSLQGSLPWMIRLTGGLDDPSPEVRAQVIALLLERLVGSDVDEFPPLLQQSWDPGEKAVLGEFQSRLKARLTQLARTETGLSRADAVSALSILDSREAAPHSLEMARSQDPVLRARAAADLGNYEGEEYFKTLVKLFQDPLPEVRQQAAIGLSKSSGRAEARAILQRALATEQEPLVREWIEIALGGPP